MDTIQNRDGSTLIPIPQGEFRMGTSQEEIAQLVQRHGWRPDTSHDEGPVHTVYLQSFYIAQFPVTVTQYSRYLAESGAALPDCWDDPRFNAPDQPVVGVGRDEALAYAAWAGLRLPTEAEWEKAARGTDRRLWPWGDEWDPHRLNCQESGPGRPTPVEHFVAAGNVSPYGVCDMAGNVWEWCLDRYDLAFYGDSPAENPCCTKPEVHYDGYYVLRGGSWYSGGERARGAARYDRFASMRRRHVGFRCARDG